MSTSNAQEGSAFTAPFRRAADRLAPHEQTFGKATFVLSLLISLVGVPLQLWDNYQSQSCDLNIVFVLLIVVMYWVRIPYIMSKRAWWMLPTEVISLVSVTGLAVQWFIYN